MPPFLVVVLIVAELWWIYLNGFGAGQSVVVSSANESHPASVAPTATTTVTSTSSQPTPLPTAGEPIPVFSYTSTPTATMAPTATSQPSPTQTATPSPTRTATPTPTVKSTPSPSPTTVPPAPSPSPASSDLDQTAMGIFQGLPSGASAVFWNLTAPGKAELNSTAQVPSASTIKLPLMIEVLRQAEQGRISLSQQHTITSDMVVGGTGILQGQVGRTLTTQQLLETTITYSDNVGANLLLDIVGMESVNVTMQRLGFSSTHFARRLMDVEAQRRGLENMTSARDMAEMVRRIYQGQLISPTASAEMMRILRLRGQQTGSSLDTLGRQLIPRPDIAHINGTLVGVHNDVGVIQSGGRAYLLAIFLHDQRDDAAAEDAIAAASAKLFSAVVSGR